MVTRYIVLDTETTGLSTEEGHRIIEIGCVEIIDRRVTNRHFHSYVNPKRPIDAAALAVHGITTDFLADKPIFQAVVDELMTFIAGGQLIIHNAPFDVGFLNYEFQLLQGRYTCVNDYCQVIDTLALARHKHPGQRNSLDALCQRYAIDNSHRQLHGALRDAQLLAQVYLRLTGGQTQLFDFNDDLFTAEMDAVPLADEKINRKPVVVYANSQEIQAHQEYLALLKARGKCLWEEL